VRALLSCHGSITAFSRSPTRAPDRFVVGANRRRRG
jgi:hypothetical protein